MNVVVDTNVIAYYLLRTEPFAEECKTFWRNASEVAAPSSWESELANVLWFAIRAGVLDLAQGTEHLRIARELGVSSVPVNHLWEGALTERWRSTIPPTILFSSSWHTGSNNLSPRLMNLFFVSFLKWQNAQGILSSSDIGVRTEVQRLFSPNRSFPHFPKRFGVRPHAFGIC